MVAQKSDSKILNRLKKSKRRPYYPNIVIRLKRVRNNFFITGTRLSGDVIFSYSGRLSKFRGNKRASYRAVQLILENYVLKFLKSIRYVNLIMLLTTPPNSITRLVVYTLKFQIGLNQIYERVRVSHSKGMKIKKARRI